MLFRSEDDPLQSLLRGECPAKHRVLLIDQARERRLGDRDERDLVGDLEHREPDSLRGVDERTGDPGVRQPGPEPEPV